MVLFVTFCVSCGHQNIESPQSLLSRKFISFYQSSQIDSLKRSYLHTPESRFMASSLFNVMRCRLSPKTSCLVIGISLVLSISVHAGENLFLPDDVRNNNANFIRGTQYDGHSPEIHIADSWPEEGPPVLWTRELGQGYSAFVAEGDYVYTQGQSLTGQYLYCLEADTGNTVWQYKYDWP